MLQITILKYTNFTINPLILLLNLDLDITKLSDFIVPVGISFFTLQGIGYLVNIYMGWEEPEKSFINFLQYIIFFPKFISGPIERSNHFLPQLKVNQLFNEQQVAEGLKIAFFGFFKKIVIANQLGVLVNGVYNNISSFNGLDLWIIVFLQPLYLYFDFSGYTDIAIGLAKTYGIELLPNFNRPLLSENITTFWRRMHMSLSFWFNDYLFKQISFRYRKWGIYASVFAVFVTFTLFGIWHGSGLNFMILGFMQALAINYEFFSKRIRLSIFSKIPNYFRTWVGRLFTYSFFGLSLILFFAPNMNVASTFISRLFIFDYNGSLLDPSYALLTALICLLLFMILEIINNDFKSLYTMISNFWTKHRFLRVALIYFLLLLIMSSLTGEVSFIYQMF
ncbi:MAG: MBOAT family protein [Candidatus Delongbacteria bacterium]|nr:MBOAT family protein [Candidatus Delongbacteria bacterium]